jgi:hypothetical protein
MKRELGGIAAAALFALAAAGCGGGEARPKATLKPKATVQPKVTKVPTVKPKATPAATNIAWGEAVDGLQAGLEMKQRAIALGGPISFIVHVRNLGAKPVTLGDGQAPEKWHSVFTPLGGGTAYESAWIPNPGDRRLMPLTVAPGAEERVALEISAPKFVGIKKQGVFSCLPPGRYALTSSYTPVTTGSVEIEIVAPRVVETAKPAATKPPASAPPAAPLTEAEARALATQLANAELAKGNVRDAGGRPVPADLRPDFWRSAVQREGRWELGRGVKVGLWAYVSFRLDGSEPQVKVDYATK